MGIVQSAAFVRLTKSKSFNVPHVNSVLRKIKLSGFKAAKEFLPKLSLLSLKHGLLDHRINLFL